MKSTPGHNKGRSKRQIVHVNIIHMRLGFNHYFVLVWSTAIFALPLCITLFVYSLQFVTTGDKVLGVLGAALLLLWAVLLRLHGPRVLIRSGAWPAICNSLDTTPRSTEELLTSLEFLRARGVNLASISIVGSGWGYFLKRKRASSPRLFMHKLTGSEQSLTCETRWLGGTTIAEVNRSLKRASGKTLPSHPTMDYITIGSWFAMGNHGNEGPLGCDSAQLFKSAMCIDLNHCAPSPFTYESYEDLRMAFDCTGTNSNLCILSVTLREDKLKLAGYPLQKRGYEIGSLDLNKTESWFDSPSVLRVLFQGGARKYAIGLTWGAIYDKSSTHWDPHLCSIFCQYAQVDTCSVLGGCHENMDQFNGKVSWSDANRWMPAILPIEAVFVVLGNYTNFEIVFRFDRENTAAVIHKLSMKCVELHRKFGGRSEIRCMGRGSAVYLDVSLRRTQYFVEPFNMLSSHFNVCRVALHPGKFTVGNTGPCVVLPLALILSPEAATHSTSLS